MVSCLLLFVLVVFLVFTWGLLGAIPGEKKVSDVSADLLGFLKKC